MHTFEITIHRKTKDSTWPVVADHSRGELVAIRTEGEMNLDLSKLNSSTTRQEYGTTLGKALFGNFYMAQAFAQARSDSKSDKEGLQVYLIVEDSELKPLHWELLCAPIKRKEWDFFSQNQRYRLLHYWPSLSERAYMPITRNNLKCLVLIANPEENNKYNLSRFDAEEILNDVEKSLGQIPFDVLATVKSPKVVGVPTLSELRRFLLPENAYTMLHIVAHGGFNPKTSESALFFTDAYDHVELVTATDFISVLDKLSSLPYFVFLASCESAAPEAKIGGALGGLAQAMIRELGTPTIVAMTEKIFVNTAQTLMANFYGPLFDTGLVDIALGRALGTLNYKDSNITVPALYTRVRNRPLFQISDQELTLITIKEGLRRLEKQLKVHAPILIEYFTKSANSLLQISGKSTPQSKEYQDALQRIEKICEQVLNLHFHELALLPEAELPTLQEERCPFLGLYPFKPEDREYFFGRDTLVTDLIQRLDTYPFLAVLGASGSGKSSLVLAGLIPTMKAYLLYMTPSNEPLGNLNKALQSRENTKAQGTDPVLVVDQFEELFTLCEDDDQRREFLAQLLKLVEDQTPTNLKVVITMRADFLGDCAPYSTLRKMIQDHLTLVPPMNTAELRSAMEQQAKVVGLEFEADLSHTILASVQGEPGAMPLLQHLLREMWKRRYGHWLSTYEYHQLGDIQQVITYTAEELYEKLPEGDKHHLRNIFMRLTYLENEGGRDTRRRATMAELIPDGQKAEFTKKLIEQLANARLVVTSVKQIFTNSKAVNDDQIEVDVAHESLINYWPRLRLWLDEDRKLRLLHQQVSKEALEWEINGQDRNYLREGKRAKEVKNLYEHPRLQLNKFETAYLKACIAPLQKRDLEEQYQRFVEQFFDVEIHIFELQAGRYPIEISLKGLYEPVHGYLDHSVVEWEMNPSIVEVGKYLFERLFADEQLKTVWARICDQHPKRRIHIHLDALPPELHAIPWESLYDIDSSQQSLQTLATDVKTPFSRYLTSQLSLVTPIIDRPLKLLIAILNPDGLERYSLTALNIEREKQIIQAALLGLESELELTVIDGAVTLSTLEEQLNKGCHIFHLVTHVLFNQRHGAALCMADKNGQVSLVRAEEFVALLTSQYQKPQLILLAGGEMAKRSVADAFRSLAFDLIAAGLPAVLAMQDIVPVEKTQEFFHIVYQELLLHGLMDLATNKARSALLARDLAVHRMPLLFSRSSNNQLFGFNEQEVGEVLKEWQGEEQRRIQAPRGLTDRQLFARQFIDLEIRILKPRETGYSVEIFLNRELAFIRGQLNVDILSVHYGGLADEYGERLFNSLFEDDPLKTAWTMLQWRYPRRRIRLHIASSAPELHLLLWELLRQPDSPFFRSKSLATDTATPFSRYLPGQRSFVEPIYKGPIKLLVAIPDPENLDELGLVHIDVIREQQIIQNALAHLSADQLEIHFMVQPVTLAALGEQLKNGYHILHLVTHSVFDKKNEMCVVIMANTDNKVTPIKEYEFTAILKTTMPHLIFLAGSETAKSSSGDAFRGLAAALFTAGVPAVLGMQEKISIATLEEFTRIFYRQLLSHGLVDLACNEARASASSWIPTLLSRLRENLLFDFSSSAAQSIVGEEKV